MGRLQHGARLVVIEDDRPELPARDVRWERDLVGLGAIEILALGIHERAKVLRTDVRQTHAHGGRDTGGVNKHRRPRVQRAVAGGRKGFDSLLRHQRRRGVEVVATHEEHVRPSGTGVIREAFGLARTPVQGPTRGGADGCGLRENLLHPRIGIERLALHDADGRQRTHDLRVERVHRLLLHQRIDHLEVTEVVWRNRHECLAAALEKLLFRWRSGASGPDLAGQEFADARAVAAGRVGIELGGFDQRGRRLRIVVLQKRAGENQHARGAGAGDEVTAFRHRAIVTRRQDEILSTLTPIRSGRTHVRDPAEPHIIERA